MMSIYILSIFARCQLFDLFLGQNLEKNNVKNKITIILKHFNF
jgi:hypothetical protein